MQDGKRLSDERKEPTATNNVEGVVIPPHDPSNNQLKGMHRAALFALLNAYEEAADARLQGKVDTIRPIAGMKNPTYSYSDETGTVILRASVQPDIYKTHALVKEAFTLKGKEIKGEEVVRTLCTRWEGQFNYALKTSATKLPPKPGAAYEQFKRNRSDYQ